MARPVTVAQLLARGDGVAVHDGRLTITPASGRTIPANWLAAHQRRLIADAARMTNMMALEYVGYSTGSYIVDKKTQRRADGVTLQFRCLVSGREVCAIFNASLLRSLNTKHGKKGQPLPKGHFTVGERSALAIFWQSTGLPYQRLSNLHQRMGNLARLIYTGSMSSGERLSAATLRPFAISAAQLREIANNSQTTRKQTANKMQTSVANKETLQTHTPQGFQPIPTTGQENYGNTVIRECGYTGSITPPELQTCDEWLADYESAPSASNFQSP